MKYYKIPFDNIRMLPEKKLWRLILETYSSTSKDFILDKADDFCSDPVWCNDNGIPFLSLTNFDYWTVAAYLYLNLKQQNQKQSQETTAR